MDSRRSVYTWRPARKFPFTYPGDRPSSSYLLANEVVYPIRRTHEGGLEVCQEDNSNLALANWLETKGLAPLHQRQRVLAYGANRNPATLHVKMQNYHYRGRYNSWAIPAFRAVIRGADVVAAGVSGQGYLFGDLLLGNSHTAETEVETWVLLVDEDQLSVLNDSEGLATNFYSLGVVQDVHIFDTDTALPALAYVSNSRIVTSPQYGTPLTFTSIAAARRSFISMTARDMLDHIVQEFRLRPDIERVTGIAAEIDFIAALMKYMNGQWWYQFNTGDAPLSGYTKLLELFSEAISETALPSTTAEYLRTSGALLDTGNAYALQPQYCGLSEQRA